MNKKIKIKLTQHEMMDLIWLMTSEDNNPPFVSLSRMHLIGDPFHSMYLRLETNKWKKKYTLSLKQSEAATLYIILYPVISSLSDSIALTRLKVIDQIDKVYGYSTSEAKIYEKITNAKT